MSTYRKSVYITLLLAFLLFSFSFVIRIYKVDTAPSGILIDEASIGYNAYSILKTGKDEHGISLPLVFKAFGDQKLPVYIYSVVPFIKLFGLGNLAVRLPSVIVGSLLCVAIFLLLLKFKLGNKIAFLGGLITATSPWTILVSRFSYESNFGLLFLVLGILFSLYSRDKKVILFSIIAGIFFGLTIYSYVAFKLITPLVLLLLIGIYFRKKYTINPLGIIIIISFLLSITPQAKLSLKQSTSRFTQIGYLFNSGTVLDINQRRYFCTQKLPQVWCSISSNKVLSYVNEYASRYSNVFSLDYLFFTGDKGDKKLNVDNFGMFYLFLLPFYLIGLVHYWNQIKGGSLSDDDLFVILSLMLVPLPSMLVGEPHKLRLLGLFPFILIIILVGISQASHLVRKYINTKTIVSILSLISILFTSFFMTDFLSIQTHKYEESYGTYIPKLMKYLYTQNKQTQIYIRSITEGVSYYAYFNAIDPHLYQKNSTFSHADAVGFSHAIDLENIHITEEDFYVLSCKLKDKNERSLYVSHENIKNIPEDAKKIIYSENGVDSLAVIYDLNKIPEDRFQCE